MRGIATLPLLKKVKKRDYVVLELDSWQLQGFGESKMSPHIAVFTTFMDDHLDYYKGDRKKYLSDKAHIFLHQEKNDFLILGRQASLLIRKKYGKKIKSKIISPVNIPSNWKVSLLGQHNVDNITLAISVANILKIPKEIIKKTVENFKEVPGRMELVKTYKKIKIYNDTTATTPHATLAALKALSHKKNVVLIIGGANKHLDMKEFLKEIPKYTKAVFVLPGTGTGKISRDLKKFAVPVVFVKNLKWAVRESLKTAQQGDIILFSPAFASFGMFKNEFDRGEQFDKIIRALKR